MIATYKELFTLLDTLSRSLDDKDVLTSSLDAFKTDILSQIQSTLGSRSNSAPLYSAAAATARPSPALVHAVPPPPISKRNEFVVTLDRTDDMLTLPVAAIKEKVVSALVASGVPRLQEAELKGIKVLPRGRLLVAARDEKTATRLKQTASYWMPKLSKNAQLVVPSYRVVVNSVPKSFKPDRPHAAQELYAHNRTAILDPSVIKEVRWLNPKALCDPKKLASSLPDRHRLRRQMHRTNPRH
jgi:hypothetical protein